MTTSVKEPPVYRQQSLLDAHRSSIQILDFSLAHWNPTMARQLIQSKKLPPFYFVAAAKQIGIDSDEWRSLRFQEWPGQMPHSAAETIAEILLKVMLRVIRTPTDESFETALLRLQQRYEALKANGISHNKIAQHLELNHHQLTRIVQSVSNAEFRHSRCPWEMLERLEHAEDEIDTKPHRRQFDYIENGHVPEPELPPKPFRIYLNSRQSKCVHCGAPSHNLKEDPERDVYGDRILTCIMCARSNFLESRPAAPAYK